MKRPGGLNGVDLYAKFECTLTTKSPFRHRILKAREGRAMVKRVCRVPQEQFVAAWNGSDTLDEAATKVRELAGGSVPRWAVMARAAELRKAGIQMKSLTPVPAKPAA